MNSKPPTIPFVMVACTLSDNLSRNSCIRLNFVIFAWVRMLTKLLKFWSIDIFYYFSICFIQFGARDTAKKVAFSHWENARWINEECAIYPHYLRFTKRKILRFPNVFTPVNSSIRSIIHQFSYSVNAGKHAFADVHRSVNTRWTSCIPAFTLSFQKGKPRVHRS